VAEQCDYDLRTFPAIRAWLNRVERQPSHVAMEFSPLAALSA
jgi:glutathione S-transferase